MKRLVLASLLVVATSVIPRSARCQQCASAGDRAARPGLESLPGERTGSAAGGTRPNEDYFARQAILEQDAEAARKRYEAAMGRWNDLK
jgi:hypothetical protein